MSNFLAMSAAVKIRFDFNMVAMLVILANLDISFLPVIGSYK
jgi:hypothetical protein